MGAVGSRVSRAVAEIRARNERRVLLLGLDGAGKSSLVRFYRARGAPSAPHARASPPQPRAAASPRDFDVHTIAAGGKSLQVWDVGGQESMRPYWRHYYTGTQGVIFVVDASGAGVARLEAAAAELAALAADEQLQDAAMLVLANRCDAAGALSESQLVTRLGLARSLAVHTWRLVPCDTLTGKGLDAGLEFLAGAMKAL